MSPDSRDFRIGDVRAAAVDLGRNLSAWLTAR